MSHQHYGRLSYHKRGTTVCCTNATRIRMATLDRAICDAVRADALRPAAIMVITDTVLKRFDTPTLVRDTTRGRSPSTRRHGYFDKE